MDKGLKVHGPRSPRRLPRYDRHYADKGKAAITLKRMMTAGLEWMPQGAAYTYMLDNQTNASS